MNQRQDEPSVNTSFHFDVSGERGHMRFADYLAQRLAREGLSHVFLVTGGGAMHLNDALTRNAAFKVVCFHHEQAAAMAAEGFARLSGVPCVLNVTTGPGGINALVGVFGAYVDSIPMFIVSGQVKLSTCMSSYPHLALRQLGDQEVDISKMVKGIVKYVRTVRSPSEATVAVERALYLMRSGRPGPVWIDIPIDVQSAQIDEEELNGLVFRESSTDLDVKLAHDDGCHPNTQLEISAKRPLSRSLHLDAQDLARRIRAAKRPVVLVGTGINTDLAKREFACLLNSIDAPVVTGWNALDLVSTAHPNFCGRPGTVGDRAGNFVVQSADLLVVLGCRLNVRQISYNWKSFAKNAFIVMVDIDAAELEKPILTLGMKIQAKVEDFLPLLNQSLGRFENAAHRAFLAWAREKAGRYPVNPAMDEAHKRPLNPYAFLFRLTKRLPEGAVIVTGNGAACVMTFQVAEVKRAQRYIANSGCASMGYDLPAAIGCAISMPKGAGVVCIAGDGSIMMNLQELQTLVSYQLNVKVFILNNGGYLSIRQSQQAYFPDNIFGTGNGDGLEIPKFEKIAAAFGIDYLPIRELEDLDGAQFTNALDSRQAAIIEVFVNPAQGFEPKLASRVNSDGTMSSPELDDMAPFLERSELQQSRVTPQYE